MKQGAGRPSAEDALRRAPEPMQARPGRPIAWQQEMPFRSTLLAFELVTVVAASRERSDLPRVLLAQAEQASPPLDGVFACYQRAGDKTLLAEADIADLCAGAADASPVDCYVGARGSTPLSSDVALSLCRCATSTAPVACYLRGYQSTTLDPSRILSLCSPEVRRHLAPDCSPER